MEPSPIYEDSQAGSDYALDIQNFMSGIPGLPESRPSAPNDLAALDAFGVVPSRVDEMGHLSNIKQRDGASPDNIDISTNRGLRRITESDFTSVDIPRVRTNLSANGGDDNKNISEGREKASVDQSKTEDENIPPAWSELKTKAGKERKRLPLACIACRRKKIRCSGEKPACKHCLRSRIPCVYKVTTRKAAPRTDYMAMLDKRLKRMEDRVIKCIPKEEQGIVNITGRAIIKPPLPLATSRSSGFTKKRAASEAFGDELDDWAKNKNERAAEVESVSADETKEPLKTQVEDAEEQNMLLEGASMLPDQDLQEHLAEVFFDYVYGQSYHLLHKPSFMRSLAQRKVPPVLMLSVCAISARFSNHPSVRTKPAFLRGEAWAKAARDIALRRYDTPNITILICYLILGLHEFGTCQGGRSWMFGGMAQRMAYALQLHKDLDHDPKDQTSGGKNELTFTDREIRRRTMWSCFLMDRFNSSGTDRPIFVGEQYIEAQLPIKERYYQMEINGPTENLEGSVPHPVQIGQGQMANAKDNMGVAAYLIRLVSIWGKLINYLNLGGKERDPHPMWSEQSAFNSLRQSTESWNKGLPDSLRYSAENLQNHASEKTANQFLFLHIVYNQILLFMYRFALPTLGTRPLLPEDMPDDFIANASQTALEAANQISALIHEANDHLVVAPFAGYCAFFSSTAHIHGAFSKNAQLEATSKQNLAWNVKYLTKMKKYWGMFHFVTENLRDLYRRHADAARSGGKTGGNGDKAIFQYGDWFDRYPHGVSGTDYEEPSAEGKKEPGSDAVLGQKSDLQTVEEFFAKLSPPSRANLSIQQQPPRKTAKKRASKSEGGKAAQAHYATAKQDCGSGEIGQQQTQDQQVTHDLAGTQTFGNDIGFQQQQSTAFPPGFQAPFAPLVPPQFMSQMDRQMVLNSYTNQNMPNASATLIDEVSGDNSNFGWNVFGFDDPGNQSANGFWGDPSTAWFMPFNVDPPTVPEDSNILRGNFDWSDPMFADLASMPLPDMPPGQTIDLGTGQDMMIDQATLGLDSRNETQ